MASEETKTEEFTAAAPPHPGAAGTGETSFGDADAPPASEHAVALEQAEGERDKYLELAQRTQADFENYRKRMARENAAAIDRGVGKLAKELLPALDHLDHALKAAEGHEDVIKGFALVRDELLAALGKSGIQAFSPAGEQFDPAGDKFDPAEHEALSVREDGEPGLVLDVVEKGYRANGTILRPARVVVSS